MSCLTVTFNRVGNGASAQFQRQGGRVTATFSPVCGTDIGLAVLFDNLGQMLHDKDGKILTAKSV